MQVTVEQIENEVKQLSKEDLRKVRMLVDSLLEEREAETPMSEEEFEQYLYEKGIIGKPPPPVTDDKRDDRQERDEDAGHDVEVPAREDGCLSDEYRREHPRPQLHRVLHPFATGR